MTKAKTGADAKTAAKAKAGTDAKTAAQAKRAAARLHPRIWVGIAGLIVSIGLIVAGIVLYRTLAPRHTDLVRLQWAGSSGRAITVVGGRADDFRTGLRWDLEALIPGYTLGLLMACYLGRRVFWTRQLHSWAHIGLAASVGAGALNAVQDWLLLIALGDGLGGSWIFRAAQALSLAKFAVLLVAAAIAVMALATTLGRLALHHSTQRQWRKALSTFPPQNGRPVSIPPPLIELAAGRIRPAPADDGFCRCWREKHPKEPYTCCTRERWDMALDSAKSRPELIGDDLCRCWWDKRSDGPDTHWAQGFAAPQQRAPGGTGICVSGGGIRSASVALGALQALRTEGELQGADYLVSVSGGGYTAGALQLALMPYGGIGPPRPPRPPARPSRLGRAFLALLALRMLRGSRARQVPPATGAGPDNVFAPGSAEEDHVRRHSSYLANGLREWTVALATLFRGVVSSLVLIGLTITTLGLAIGKFYRIVPVVDQGNLARLQPLFLVPAGQPAPRYPVVPPGVTLAVGLTAALMVLVYLVQLGAVPEKLLALLASRIARVLLGATILLAAIGLVLPALIWAGSRVTWSLGFSPLTTASVGSLSVVLSYLGTVVATLWRKRTTLAKTARSATSLSKGPVNQVLPNSVIQMIIMWICLGALVLAALLLGGWIAASSLVSSWWALVPVGALAGIATFVDQTSLSLHPFYRQRIARTFAVRRTARPSGDVADPYPYHEMTWLSRYARRVDGFPGVTFNVTANVTGSDRTPPGRPAVPFTLAHDYIGGPQAGWVRTDFLEQLAWPRVGADLTVEAAMAISGAAFASAMGSQTRFYEVFLALSNARLGAWLPNPYFVALKLQHLDNWTIPGLPRIRRLSYFAREIFGIHPSTGRLLLCTDGGHYDNLGLVEMLRRRCKRIYCIDASGAKPPLDDTLATAITLAREELGVEISLTKAAYDLVPGGRNLMQPARSFTDLNKRLSKSAVTIADITYPPVAGRQMADGEIVFAQAVLTPDMPYQLLDFPQDDPGFPWDSTGDQWFSASQFDAYQQLGQFIGQDAAKRAREHAAQSAVAGRGGGPPCQQTPKSLLRRLFRIT